MSENALASYHEEKILESPLNFSEEIGKIRKVIQYDGLSSKFPRESYDWIGNAYKTVSDLLEGIEINENIKENECLLAFFYGGKVAKIISATIGNFWAITRNNNTINYGPILKHKQEIKFSMTMPSSESATCLQGLMSSFNASRDYFKSI